MLNLKLSNGAALDIPPHSILMVEEHGEKPKTLHVVYSLEPGHNQVEEVTSTYGHFKKNWKDSGAMPQDLLEVTVAQENKCKLAFSGAMVIARKELIDAEHGANTELTMNVGGKIIRTRVTDKRDTLVGD